MVSKLRIIWKRTRTAPIMQPYQIQQQRQQLVVKEGFGERGWYPPESCEETGGMDR